MPGQRRNDFRFEGKFIFLTYPRCELRPDYVKAQLEKNFDIKHFCIASEEHEEADEDGVILHIHAVLEFDRIVRTRIASAFDIDGFHPNIQGLRSRKAALDYVRKDGDFINNFPDTQKTSWASILATATTRDDFLAGVREHYARDYVLQYDRLLAFADVHYQPVIPEYVNNFEFNNVHPHLTAWVDNNLANDIGKNLTFSIPFPHSMITSFIASFPNPNGPSARP